MLENWRQRRQRLEILDFLEEFPHIPQILYENRENFKKIRRNRTFHQRLPEKLHLLTKNAMNFAKKATKLARNAKKLEKTRKNARKREKTCSSLTLSFLELFFIMQNS